MKSAAPLWRPPRKSGMAFQQGNHQPDRNISTTGGGLFHLLDFIKLEDIVLKC